MKMIKGVQTDEKDDAPEEQIQEKRQGGGRDQR